MKLEHKKLIVFILFVSASISFAQQKLFTVEDVVINSYSKLLPSNLRQLNWLPNQNEYAWVDGSGEKGAILKSGLKTNQLDTLLKISDLNVILGQNNLNSLNSFPTVKWITATQFNFWNKNNYLSYDIKSKKITKLNFVEGEADNETVSPNFKYVAFTKANNLYLNLDNTAIQQISFDTDSNVVNGQSVHRNEFGINNGIFWSPNSNLIAYYRMDQSMVTDYPLVDVSLTPARLKNLKYPMAGQTSHHVTVGIYNIHTKNTIWLKTGEPLDQYLTCLTWSPDEKYFYIAHLNRDQNHMELKKYDAATGNLINILFEEKNDKYVEPENPLYFLPNSNVKFLWFSERDGFNHLYLYNSNGNLIKQITKGNWVVNSFDGFDKAGKNIFIYATKESPLERHYYKVNIESGKIEKISGEGGMHTVFTNSNSDYFIDSYTNTSTPRKINLINQNFEVNKVILNSDNPLKDYKIGKTRIFSLKNDDGIDLYCRIITPPDFDSTNKYPVIFYVYGGPHAQEVTNSFGVGKYNLWFYMMAQKGYIVFTLDNRGSSNRGLEFEQATFRNLGTVEIKDQMTGVSYLKTLPFVDENRFGVYGWSYGGFMTTSLMLRTDNTFKVGACGGAVIDWKYYEVMYTERYMDTPETNSSGYKEANLLNYVQNLNGKLLLVHGTSDPTVVWQNTLSFAKKAAELNKALDYFPYLGHGHGVSGRDAIHLYTKITNYFIENL